VIFCISAKLSLLRHQPAAGKPAFRAPASTNLNLFSTPVQWLTDVMHSPSNPVIASRCSSYIGRWPVICLSTNHPFSPTRPNGIGHQAYCAAARVPLFFALSFCTCILSRSFRTGFFVSCTGYFAILIRHAGALQSYFYRVISYLS